MNLIDRLRWKAKQSLAGDSHFYGDGGTLHQTTGLDVEVHNGEVVAVWYRCSMLPFKQVEVDEERSREMKRAHSEVDGGVTMFGHPVNPYLSPGVVLTGVEIRDSG